MNLSTKMSQSNNGQLSEELRKALKKLSEL